MNFIVFLVISLFSVVEPQGEYAWQPLFDGKTLTHWSVPVFGGDGEVQVKDGNLVIGQGAMITGIKYEKVFPRVNYEIRYEAKRTKGNDFFGALTFPVGDSCCTFINGGWGGGTVGLSCVDGMDASENETSSFFSFKDNQWYKFRIFVTGTLIRVWIDEPTKDGKRKETLIVDLKMGEKKISLRDETSQYQPLGFCTWVSEGWIRNIEYRKLKPKEVKN
ncbi:MAG: DUF1080 domain-containing protein [Planctomycetaceae bacterium]|jgi:hypothetical protein|nr:DUF1080 domain-containing protein [Planctomycetaceae bacterium]